MSSLGNLLVCSSPGSLIDHCARSARKYHPDKNRDNAAAAEATFAKIAYAYGVLTDPEKREVFDRSELQLFEHSARAATSTATAALPFGRCTYRCASHCLVVLYLSLSGGSLALTVTLSDWWFLVLSLPWCASDWRCGTRLGEPGLERMRNGDPSVKKGWLPNDEILRRHHQNVALAVSVSTE